MEAYDDTGMPRSSTLDGEPGKKSTGLKTRHCERKPKSTGKSAYATEEKDMALKTCHYKTEETKMRV